MVDKGGKSAMKSQNGNGDSAGRSRKGKKLQFDSEDLGVKGDKGSNDAKKAATKAPPVPPERKLDRGIPPNSTYLMDSEAADILQGIQDHMVFLSQDPDIKLPVSFDKGLAYAKRGENRVKPQSIKKILEPLKDHGVSDAEICLISNVSPESVDEVFALIPTLKPNIGKLKGPLEIALDELANHKESLANLDGLL